MSNRKPVPLFDRRPRVCCPVCGETSYSSAGIHPQCAARRMDEQRMNKVRHRAASGQLQKPAAVAEKSLDKRVCPECDQTQTIRRKTCSCGFIFTIDPQPADHERHRS